MTLIASKDHLTLTPGDFVKSPCISVCRMNAANGLCDGCWRTLDEIAAWSRLDEAGRRVVAERALLRRPVTEGPAA